MSCCSFPRPRSWDRCPDGAQHNTKFSVALGTAAVGLSWPGELHTFLAGEEARDAYRNAGLDVPPLD